MLDSVLGFLASLVPLLLAAVGVAVVVSVFYRPARKFRLLLLLLLFLLLELWVLPA